SGFTPPNILQKIPHSTLKDHTIMRKRCWLFAFIFLLFLHKQSSAQPCQPVVILTSPHPLTVCEGTTATFNVAAIGTGLSYQWRKNGINISGATSALYRINNLTLNDAGDYDVDVTSTCGPMRSAPATLVVSSKGTWIGVIDSSWNLGANWCGGVPDSNTDVIV